MAYNSIKCFYRDPRSAKPHGPFGGSFLGSMTGSLLGSALLRPGRYGYGESFFITRSQHYAPETFKM